MYICMYVCVCACAHASTYVYIGELAYDRLNGTRKIVPLYAKKSVIYI